MNKSIKKFIPRFEDQSQNISIIDINDLISKDSVKALKHAGAFTGHSVVLGTEHDTAWLLKINDEVKPANTHIHDELDSTEAAASEYGRKIGLADMISFSIDGKVIWSDDTESGCVAVKFFSDDYLTAVDAHRLGEKLLKDTITKFIQNNKMLKAAIFLYIIGDIDCNGNNILANLNDLKLIDFGLSFADDNWTPVPHDVPYFMRLLGEEAWKAIPVDYEYQKDFKFWITFLKEDDLIDVCHKYKVDYEGAIHRLHLIKDLVTSNNVMADSWNLWHNTLGVSTSENLVKAPHIDNNLSNLSGDSKDDTYEKAYMKSYKMPNDMIIHQHKTDDGTMFSITDDNKKNGNRIAHLRVEHSDVPGVNNKVSIVHVDPEHRNSGYGKALYDTAIHHYKTLDSDSLLSPQSNKMWTSQLANDPKYSVALGTMGHWKPHTAKLKTKKSEDLIKAPIDYDTGETAQSWQEYPRTSKREELHRVMIHPGKHHDRVAMIKGLGQETQKKKIDGVWNLKLYRGVSEGEHPDDYKVEPKSFTSNKDVAQQFASKYGGEAVEQWVPVHHISYSFNHAHLADGPKHEENAHEHEVIVGPKHGE